MSIWKNRPTLEQLREMSRGTMDESVDLRFEEIGDDYIKASMAVDHRTMQPVQLLHGGASCVLAETLGSTASNMCVDAERKICVGLEINANHLRGVGSGRVTATAKPFHIGGRTHVWHIEIHDEEGRLTCVSRLTTAILERPGANPILRMRD